MVVKIRCDGGGKGLLRSRRMLEGCERREKLRGVWQEAGKAILKGVTWHLSQATWGDCNGAENNV
jgi:hypothetical protein